MPGKLNVYLQFPTAWDELLPAEVIEISRQQLISANHIHTQKANILCFIIELRAKEQKIKLPRGWVSIIDPEQMVVNGYTLLEFIYGENSLTKVPESRISLPGLFSPAVHAPKHGFQSITCGEFEDAETRFYEFIENPTPEPLAHLASILWRPNSFSLSFREGRGEVKPYMQLKPNGESVTYHAEKLFPKFLKLKPWQLYAVFTWYHGSRNQLPQMFPTVHETHGEAKNDEPDIMAFTKCIHSGAGPKNGSRIQIRRTLLFEYMYEMEQEAIKANEMKEEYERLKNQT